MKTAQKRTLSTHAQVAKNIRNFTKSMGVKCRAVSDSYSMGSSVNWYVEDLHPDIFDKIRDFANQHQYGGFNAMEDIYESSNSRDDIAQVKHVFDNRGFSDQLTEKAWLWLREKLPGNAKDLPSNYSDAKELNFYTGEQDYNPHQTTRGRVHGILSGDDFHGENWREFWASIEEKKEVQKVVPINIDSSITIEEHTHTKKGFQMFICIFPYMDREQYLSTLEGAQSNGGWYSRKWGKTPAGFAFKEHETAKAFIDSLEPGTTQTETSQTTTPTAPKKKTSQGAKLRTLAEKLTSQIDAKRGDRLTNTPKRLKEAASARNEADRLERTQNALYALAGLHETEALPALLEKFISKKSVYDAMSSASEVVNNGFHAYYTDTNEPRDTSPETIALWSLLSPESDEAKKEKDLKSEVEKLQFCSIPGYFPTPKTVIDLMLSNIDIKPGHKILEPSGGSGAILDAIKDHEPGATLHTCEVNHSLRSILDKKGYELKEHNFLDYNAPAYDAVLMNPPFENLQDIEHIQHAYSLLKTGGRLVAIMSPSAFFRMDKKSEAFRTWFYLLDGLETDLPENSFKGSGTGVNTKLIVLDK